MKNFGARLFSFFCTLSAKIGPRAALPTTQTNYSLNGKKGMDHSTLVKRLAKPGEEILETMTAHQAHILHMAVGICGESGELIDAIKKNWAYNKPLDIENVMEELGDIEFYMEGMRQALHLTREEVIQNNIVKLEKRYGSGKYSDAQAQLRQDKS
jgi:NTP pyrophosphatase (non-canonical NTP hydrolase)